jgi:hypothetical protein
MLLKRLILATALVAALFSPVSPAPETAPDSTSSHATTDCTVYITRTGHRYHRAGCRYLRHSSFAMSRSQAIAHRYTPCLICGGSDCEK